MLIDGRRELAERLRGYFEVQLLFAETIADRTSRTLSDSCRSSICTGGLAPDQPTAGLIQQNGHTTPVDSMGARSDRIAFVRYPL